MTKRKSKYQSRFSNIFTTRSYYNGISLRFYPSWQDAKRYRTSRESGPKKVQHSQRDRRAMTRVTGMCHMCIREGCIWVECIVWHRVAVSHRHTCQLQNRFCGRLPGNEQHVTATRRSSTRMWQKPRDAPRTSVNEY